MTDERKQKVAALIADWFNIKPDEETGEYDLDDYEWTSGCYHGYSFDDSKTWLSLAKIVEIIDYYEYELYDILAEDEDY